MSLWESGGFTPAKSYAVARSRDTPSLPLQGAFGRIIASLTFTLVYCKDLRNTLSVVQGNVITVGRKSPYSLYNQKLSSFEDDEGAYDQKDAAGFIKLQALRLQCALPLFLSGSLHDSVSSRSLPHFDFSTTYLVMLPAA